MNKKHLLVLCLCALFLTSLISCTESSLNDDDTVQINKDKYMPDPNG